MTGQGRPSLAKKQTRVSKATRDEGLDRGIAFTDFDGTRLVVRIGDVRGTHDRALRQLIGLDFEGLLGALSQTQGTDLLAAVVWFGRLVNNHNTRETYDELLDKIGYEAFLELDPGDPTEGDSRPEASGSVS